MKRGINYSGYASLDICGQPQGLRRQMTGIRVLGAIYARDPTLNAIFTEFSFECNVRYVSLRRFS
jgi:hypothetical protein